MSGEALALLAALAYGLAGVSIIFSKRHSRGDNGLFLSILLTTALSWSLWLAWGVVPLGSLAAGDGLRAIGIFALAGVFANLLGRQFMYRATERIGAVRAGLLRRLTPLFAVPLAFVLLDQRPAPVAVFGGLLVLAGVLVYMRRPAGDASPVSTPGVVLGVLSPMAYALAYSLRGLGLALTPDAALGAMIGAATAATCLVVVANCRRGIRGGWRYLTIDMSARHWWTAMALSLGQVLQFFALKTAPVMTVAVLGTLETLFAAAFIMLFTRNEAIAVARLLIASLLAMAGTALLFLT